MEGEPPIAPKAKQAAEGLRQRKTAKAPGAEKKKERETEKEEDPASGGETSEGAKENPKKDD